MKEKKRKVGRPKLPKAEVKHVVAIRLSDLEKRDYEEEASLVGLSLSDWVRQTIRERSAPIMKAGLADKIVDLCKRGILPKRFGVADISKHFSGVYADNYIKTVLANYSEDTGNYVKRGQEARFKRVADGAYECA